MTRAMIKRGRLIHRYICTWILIENLGKGITPLRSATIITLRSLPNPVTFQKIKDLTGIPISTANDIWLHAVDNARNARLADGENLEKPLSLLELVDAKCLDPDTRSGRPEALTEAEKDCLIATVKRDFTTRQMKLVDLRREAGLSHVGDGTVHRALVSRSLHAYREEFKPILGPEYKLNRLVSILTLLLLPD